MVTFVAEPVFQVYEVPPDAAKIVLCPAQNAVVPLGVTAATGFDPTDNTLTETDVVHPIVSVIVQVYVPAARPLFVAEFPPGDQEYLYPGVPPAGVAEADPSLRLQVAAIGVAVAESNTGWFIVTTCVLLQLFASLITQV